MIRFKHLVEMETWLGIMHSRWGGLGSSIDVVNISIV